MTAYWQTQLTNALARIAAQMGACVRVPGMDDVIKAFSHDPGGSDG